LLHGPAYRRNVSLRRWANHRIIADQFAVWSRGLPPPDLILCSLPNLELSREAVRYGRENRVPVVLDLRDMWPDIFLDLVPAPTRPLLKPVLRGLYADLHEACTGATALTGISPEFIEWGLAVAGRPRSRLDRHFWLAYRAAMPRGEEIRDAEARWRREGIEPGTLNPVACFFGAMSGKSFEMSTVLEAARSLERTGSPWRFVLCGAGDSLEKYRGQAQGLRNVIFPGWVTAAEIWALMRASLVGLAPYRSRSDFVASIPNKSIEYLSAGLPVISSLQGSLARLLARAHAGLTYANGDVDALLTALQQVLDCPQERAVMAGNAAELYQREFVAERVYDEMAAYLEEIVRERGGNS
jgi:glycosyltransferase involved in cell wall biosynthesis